MAKVGWLSLSEARLGRIELVRLDFLWEVRVLLGIVCSWDCANSDT